MEPFYFLISSARTKRDSYRAPGRGFTLIEMLVVLAIIGIMMLVIITGQSTFSRTLLLTDTAYTVALSAREAQTYGISSHLFSSDQNTAYGLYFTPNALTYSEFGDIYPASPGSNTSYCPGHTETDPTKPDARPGNCLYDSANGELVRLYSFGQGYSIGAITAYEPGNPTIVSPNPVDITFQRPNTTATLVGYVGSSYTALSEVHVKVVSPQGTTECIVFTQLGEISVQQSCT